MKAIQTRITLAVVLALAALAVAWGLLLASRSQVALANGPIALDLGGNGDDVGVNGVAADVTTTWTVALWAKAPPRSSGQDGLVAANTTFRYVAPDGNDGNDCDSIANRCQSVQRAVDVANAGDRILIAGGTYAGVQARPAPAGYANPPASGTITQVVHITKTVVVSGGYSANFGARDPAAYPTTIDAQDAGRAIFVGGNVTVTLDGLHVTGGDATGLGGANQGDTGGGICAQAATLTVHGCQLVANAARNGGGVGSKDGDVTLSGNTIQGNTAHVGGGVGQEGGMLVLEANVILDNVAVSGGGAFYAWGGAVDMDSNVIRGNAAQSLGGGGGYLVGSDCTMDNNILADNQAAKDGTALYLHAGSYAARHNTIVGQGQGSGVCVDGGIVFGYLTSTWVNNIVANHGVGVTVRENNTAILEATLWGGGVWDNGQDWGGAGSITHTVDVHGNPAFLNPGAGNYHIGPRSAALDAGLDAGLRTDIDGHERPIGDGYDIGADECNLTKTVYLPLVVRNYTAP